MSGNAAVRPTTRITITIEPIELSHAEVWPDWDGEATMTAADVAAMIRSEGIASIIEDWNLHPAVTVEVITEQENPAYGGDDVLFGSPPPKMLVAKTVVRIGS